MREIDPKMCNKSLSNYPSTISLVPDQLKTQEMWDKVVNACPFLFDSIPD